MFDMTNGEFYLYDTDDYVPEPVRYGFVVDNHFVSGTLQEYAKIWEGRQYDDSSPSALSAHVITWDGESKPVTHKVDLTRGETDENDDVPYYFSVNGETVRVTIDGRA